MHEHGQWQFWCGYGSCNFFGCNCDGGCRVPPKVFKELDKNGDGHIQQAEMVYSELEQGNLGFDDLDSNGDGKLSPHELVPLIPLNPGLKGLND